MNPAHMPVSTGSNLPMLPVRLPPGADLRQALQQIARAQAGGSAFVVAGMGSLQVAQLRFAGEDAVAELAGPLEILSLSGTLSVSGAHLHMSVSDATGRVWGGHVADGNLVRTTAEVLLAPLPGWRLTREHDAATGYSELVVRRAE
jgi:predicted DNA-binding protein with PD1-like motif